MGTSFFLFYNKPIVSTMKKAYSYLLFLLFSSFVYGQENDLSMQQTVENRLLKQTSIFPQEKLHLHLDRTHYVPGEKLWFKAYLVNASSLESPVDSRYVYVELIAPSDSVVSRIMVRPEEGLHHGVIPLPDKLEAGTYRLRAYTRYLENQGEDSFFHKSIQIGALSSVKTESDYDVSFFPEGGNLLEGVLCRIAFKALKNNGYFEDISGYIINEAGDTLANKVQSHHNGMGLIDFICQKGERYFLVCKNRENVEKRFELPKAVSNAYTLQTYWRKNDLLVARKNSPDVSAHAPLYLLIHQNGNLCYWDKWEENSVLTFPKEKLPQGVLQILLFDSNLNPLSERLVFSNKQDFADVNIAANKTEYNTREKVTAQLHVTDKLGAPLSGNFSIAVTNDNDVAVDSTAHIISTLLLSSELRGHIENPAYYFQQTPEAEIHLDLVMRIHGWRRYNIPEVVKEEYTYPHIPAERAQVFTGEVQKLLGSKPVKNGDVTLWISSPNSAGYYLNQTQTNEKGQFCFDNLELPDGMKVFIQSLNKGNTHVRLDVDLQKFPSIQPMRYWSLPFRDKEKDMTIFTYMQKARQRVQYDEDMKLVQLDGIEVVASKKVEKESPYKSHYSSIFTQALDQEAIERSRVTNLIDLFYQVPGVRVVGNTNEKYLVIRSSLSLSGDAPALILIDGMEVDAGVAFSSVDISSVARIEVLKSSDAGIFGAKGAYGAVNIILKDASKMEFEVEDKDNTRTITPLGYQQPVEFYSPKYDTPEQKNSPQADMRATVYWKPDLFTGEDGIVDFEFYTSDMSSTTYSVVVEGITQSGKLARSIQKIVLK